MAEFLRWILLALGVLLLVGIWWWGSRRATQAPGNAELREVAPPHFKEPEFAPEPRERSASSFEPVNIHPAAFDRIPAMREPIMVDIEPEAVSSTTPRFEPEAPEPPLLEAAEPVSPMAPEVTELQAEREAPAAPLVDAAPAAAAEEAARSPAAPRAQPTPPAEPSAVAGAGDSTGSFATAAAPAPNTAEKQKIISVRVCTTGATRWQGSSLLAAFELNGLAYGRYQVFHRRHVDGRSLFCVASMTEPGVFDVTKMQNQEFKGVTLFAVLPGPLEPMLTVDELLLAARDLAIALNGAVQDAKGSPMTAQRAAALRDEVARFQASLPAG